MGLYADLRITDGRGSKSIGMLEIVRQEPLIDRENPHDETHRYVARIGRKQAEVMHRYGDGAWRLVERALEQLDIDTGM